MWVLPTEHNPLTQWHIHGYYCSIAHWRWRITICNDSLAPFLVFFFIVLILSFWFSNSLSNSQCRRWRRCVWRGSNGEGYWIDNIDLRGSVEHWTNFLEFHKILTVFSVSLQSLKDMLANCFRSRPLCISLPGHRATCALLWVSWIFWSLKHFFNRLA